MQDPAATEANVLLFGSPSSERLVSVASAQFVASRLPARLWFWTEAGGVLEVSRATLEAHRDAFTRDFRPMAEREWPSLDAALDTLTPQRDILFLCLHGGEGENGELQRRLEARGLAFTGSDSRASQLAFNKSEALSIASAHGLRVAHGLVLPPRHARVTRALVEETFASLGPMVIKPESGGSSIMLAFVRRAQDCEAAATLLAQNASLVFRAEQIVSGREFTLGVIERDGHELALPCSEVVMFDGRDFDYEGKYLGAGSREITPAAISDEIRDHLQRDALAIHRALGCRGYSRSDFILDGAGPVFLETNTLPGLSIRSFIPQQLEAAGIPFEEFARDQISVAVARRRGAIDQGES